MGKEFTIYNEEELCDLMCDNIVPEHKIKATVRYRDPRRGNLHEQTIEVDRNNVEFIIREFCRINKLPWWIYIHTVICNGYEYKWKAIAEKAGVEKRGDA